jgi:hypothetical protein
MEFGYGVLKAGLTELLDDYSDEIKASRKRLEKSLHPYSV